MSGKCSKNHYLDNSSFFEKFVKWRKSKEFIELKKIGGKPKAPDYIMKDAWLIIQNYTRQRKWYNIPEDVLEDAQTLAADQCIRYLHNFDPARNDDKPDEYLIDKNGNVKLDEDGNKRIRAKVKPSPLAYVTQITHNAILQSYNWEKKEMMNKMQYLTSTMSSATYIRTDGVVDNIVAGEYAQNHIKHLDTLAKDYNNS